ncbi:TlpA disulfide reductase family protein [Thalassotalea psychrophila]|uniref:TlpA disulfide reductase family protein n=1 Tax=Thalassotalea psychrophila TaxID=3065647 RepID=A0ABY9TNW9_9GAMM|nr:TlpA disulfide reductase family protein [Colwelliaceae bacterium SQ149]
MKGFIAQLLIIVLVVNLVSMVRETSMLSSWHEDTAPNFELTTLSGENAYIYLSKQGLEHNTIVYFFAPWCAICRVSIHNLQNIYERDNNVSIVAVALDFVDKEEVAAFSEDLNLSFPILFGNEEVKQSYQVSAYPSYYVLDQLGKIEHRSMGYSTELGLFLRSR